MQRGFTIMETLIVVGMTLVLFGLSVFIVARVQDNLSSNSADISVINAMTTASRRARAGDQGSAWGVYFPYDEVDRTTNTITIFSGTSYAARDTALDTVVRFPERIEFESVMLSGSGPSSGDDHEIVFDVITGRTSNYGSIDLKSFEQERSISISPEGIVTREF